MLQRDTFDTACEHLYILIDVLSQKDFDHSDKFSKFVELAREITSAAPSLALKVADVSSLVLLGRYEDALSECTGLIASERKIIDLISLQTVH